MPGKWRLGTLPCCPNCAYPVASQVKREDHLPKDHRTQACERPHRHGKHQKTELGRARHVGNHSEWVRERII